MKALVSTSRSLLAVDLTNGNAEEIHTGRGLYFGITYSEEYIFVAARNNFDCFEYLDNLEHTSGLVLIFSYDLKLVGSVHLPSFTTAATLRDLHQIIFFDDKLWLACARDNVIMVFDSKTWEYWFPSEDKKDRWKDIHHFNSLWVDYGKDKIYVLAHKRGPSEIWEFSYPDLKLTNKILDFGEQAHNMWRIGADFYTCDSKNSAIISTGGFKWPADNFTRGAVITEDKYIIGISDIAKKDERRKSSGAIDIYDVSWNKLRRINIRNFGQVNDIRIPGVYDLCHHWELGKPPEINLEAKLNFEVEEV